MSSQLPIYLLDEIRLSEFMTLLKNIINQREKEEREGEREKEREKCIL